MAAGRGRSGAARLKNPDPAAALQSGHASDQRISMTSTTDTDTAIAPPSAVAEPADPISTQPAARPGKQGGRRARHQPRQKAAAGDEPRQQQPQQQAQRQRKVNPVLEKLFELYPKMFGARFLPLKLGVYQDLLALHPDEFKREDLKVALGLHARSTRYLEAVASGQKRHDLNGVPVEDVAPEHVHHAIIEVFRRRQARTPDDLRPKLRDQFIRAIETSGLSREDYTLIVRTQDEIANAVLDEAFAEIGARTAKGEALLRAFEASGRTVAEFAEMYGMDLAEVSRTLERARPRAA